MKNKIFLILFLLLKGNPLYSYPSLFFSDEEIFYIRENLQDEEQSINPLYLLAIIYLDSSHWSLWVNHKIIRPETEHVIEGYHLEEVTSSTATFSWTPANTLTPLFFTLHANQTYLSKKRKVIDGLELGGE
ncbi:MAG: hypothetical protein K2W92_10080 [Alphaproteobacteria bacterium]|nr:hypothetical protein [Alphaproteobacteria bacterium]